MSKLNIEAMTGKKPEALGLTANTHFLADGKGDVVGIATSDASFDYDTFDQVAGAPDLGQLIKDINEEQGEANEL